MINVIVITGSKTGLMTDTMIVIVTMTGIDMVHLPLRLLMTNVLDRGLLIFGSLLQRSSFNQSIYSHKFVK